MSPDAIPISTSVLISVASAIVSALVTVIVYLDRKAIAKEKATEEAVKAERDAKDKAEHGRLEDLRQYGKTVLEVHQQALPLFERVAHELRLVNERRAKRDESSDPPPPRSRSRSWESG